MAVDIEYPGSADNWGEVLNTNFSNIETAINTIENALLDLTNADYDDYDDLKGGYGSLAERLATVIESSTMLQDWALSRASNLETTNTINSRIQKVEQEVMVQKNNASILSGAPDEVQRAWDARAVGSMDDQFFIGGDIGRWGPSGIDSIGAGSGSYEVRAHNDPVYCSLGSRWYSNNDREYIATLNSDGTWTAFYQTFEETETTDLVCLDTQLAIDSSDTLVDDTTTAVTINGMSFEQTYVGIFLTAPNIPLPGDIVTLTPGGSYKVATVSYSAPTWTLTFYGKVDPQYFGSGSSISWRIHRPWQIPYISLHKDLTDAEIIEKISDGGRVLCGEAVSSYSGSSVVCTSAVEYNTFSRYKFVEMDASGWSDVAAGNISVAYSALKGFFKNIIPVVITSSEIIYAMDLGAGWSSDIIYLYKPYATAQVTTSPKTGTAVDRSDIETVGVLVEI